MPINRTPIGYELTLVALAADLTAANVVALPAPAPAPVSLPATGYGLVAVALAERAAADTTYVLAA